MKISIINLDVLSFAYLTMLRYENTNLIQRESEELIIAAKKLWHGSDLLTLLQDPETQLKSNEEQVKIIQAVASELENTLTAPAVSIEASKKKFCGIDINQLTQSQKKLMGSLTPAQREELSQKVSINKTLWQIEFLNIKKAIKDCDIAKDVNKISAERAVQKLWNGWQLPKDVDFTSTNRLRLDPENSDYDAMILEMPWGNDNEKTKNFKLLTDMYWRYWTWQSYGSKLRPRCVFRRFSDNSPDRTWAFPSVTYSVRPVKSL